jgi:hypothetical protein
MARLQPFEIVYIHCYKSSTCQPIVCSYYISSLDDIDLKSEISDKCHKTDPYYYQIYYFKCGLRLGLAPTVFYVQFQDQSRLLNASVSFPFSRCPCIIRQMTNILRLFSTWNGSIGCDKRGQKDQGTR